MISLVSVLLIFAFLLAPIFVLTICFLPKKHASIRAWIPVGATGTVLLVLLLALPHSLNGHIFQTTPLEFLPGVDFYFRIDLFGLYFGLVSAFIWFLAAIYSLGYMKDAKSLTRYYCFFTMCLYFTLGIGFAGNLFTLFIFYELVTLSGYPLIVHEGSVEARKAALKYLFYTLTGDTFVLFCIFIVYRVTGTMKLDGTMPHALSSIPGFYFLILLAVMGFGVKAALMPLHGWVADAHPAAPAPASALLSGVLVNVGLFGMARIFYNISGSNLLFLAGFSKNLIPLALFTIIAASLIAINQDNLKRRLAYSTIGQLSYIILGFALNNESGLSGALVHIANHAVMKATLFLCAGAIIKETGIKNVSEMKGLAKRMPLTMIIFTIAALGIVGTPPTSGFISKWLLCMGALEAGQPFYVIVLLLSSLLASIYFLPVVYTAFFQKPEQENWKAVPVKPFRECSRYMLFSMLTGGTLVLVFGIFVLFRGSPLDISLRIARAWLK